MIKFSDKHLQSPSYGAKNKRENTEGTLDFFILMTDN